MFPMTPWVTRLLVANVAVYFALRAVPPALGNSIANSLIFIPQDVLLRPWTPITYMFLHADFGHLFGNMLGVFFFGPRLETKLGTKGFLTLYFAAGIGGALFESILAIFVGPVAMLGASGGVFGILAGFAYYWPRETIILFPIPIPVQAWVLVTVYVLWSLYAGLNASVGGGVAHFAHLGGAAVALGYLRWSDWHRGSAQRDFQRKLRPDASPGGIVGDKLALERWKGISIAGLHELNREEVERLLEKARAAGPKGLTASEREFMDRMSSG